MKSKAGLTSLTPNEKRGIHYFMLLVHSGVVPTYLLPVNIFSTDSLRNLEENLVFVFGQASAPLRNPFILHSADIQGRP